MSVVISKESNNCIVVTVTGVFTYEDLEDIQAVSKTLDIRPDDKVNCLILAEQFTGWGKGGDWGDLTFMYENDPLVGKIAVVAQENRQDEMLMFLGAGRRQAEVKVFFPDEVQDARDWLQSKSE